MAAHELKPVYLVSGGDRPKITRALHRLRSHFDGNSVEHLNATEASGEDVVAACNVLGLFGGGRRLVIVDEVDGRRTGEGRLTGGWKVADIRAAHVRQIGCLTYSRKTRSKAWRSVRNVQWLDPPLSPGMEHQRPRGL